MRKYNKKQRGFIVLILPMLLTLIASLLFKSSAFATETDVVAPTQSTIKHVLKSNYPRQDRTVSVQLPKGYMHGADTRYPVLYILDGESNLEFTSDVVVFLTTGGQIPEMIIVGIHAGVTRDQDYLPAISSTTVETSPFSGNGAQFLNYIEKELIPFIDGAYSTTDFRLLSGHSYGGVFATYAMSQSPDLFGGYFVQSPYFNLEIARPMSERLRALFASKAVLHSSYFMTFGDEPLLAEGAKLIGDVLDMKSSATFRFTQTRQSGRDHMQTRMVGVYQALEQYFEIDWPLRAAIKSQNISAHFESLSQKYGVRPQYSVQVFAQTIGMILQGGDVKNGTAMAQEFVSQHPTSPFSHFLLFNAYAMRGKNDLALVEVTAAIKIIDGTVVPSAEMQQMYPQLKHMQKQLSGK